MKQWIGAALAVVLAGLAAFAPEVRALGVDDLLPVDQAYRLEAHAVSRERIELTWTVAPGYYLYRHRFAAQPLDPGFVADPLQLPPGHKKHDEFFGDVETYRDRVTAVLTGTADAGTTSVRLKVKYQGCADVGVCYPPQTRTLIVSLPPAPAQANAAASPASAGDPLAALTGRAAPAAGATGTDRLPLPAEQAFKAEAIALSSSQLLVRLTPAPGYYLYRDKSHFRVADGDGVTLGAPQWPTGTPHRDEHFGDVIVYFDLVEVPVPVQRANTQAQTVSVELAYQGCQTDGICYPPMSRTVAVELPAGAGASADVMAASATTRAPTTPTTSGDETAPPADTGLLAALLLALGGGLILNLMPCVLPVLSFKALGLAQGGESHARARAHALWYTAGVLASFAAIGALVLALRRAGQALGWGFQLQEPWLIGSLVLLLFAIGLSLSGLWQFGASLAGTGESLTRKSGAAGDFFTGVLAVVVASPCTAPFMGTALAFAFAAPALQALLVFLALGLGLALPFLLIGFVPALASRLPKPGAWMDTLKQWLAFPMYLTAIWLAWVFGKQRGTDALAVLLVGAVLLAIGLWWFERQRYTEGVFKKALAWLFLAAALVTLAGAVRLPHSNGEASATAEGSEPYSAARLAELRAQGRPVFIDMTADWCITCKVNEKAVFATDDFKQLLKETNTVYMIGDWTNEDAAISAFLDQYHAPGVPLYVVYPAGGGVGKKLPQVLSLSLMREELTRAAGK